MNPQRILPSSGLNRIIDKEGAKYLQSSKSLQSNEGDSFLVKTYGDIFGDLRPISIIHGDRNLWGAVDENDLLVIPCKYESLTIDNGGHILVEYGDYYKYSEYNIIFSATCEDLFEIDHLGNPILRINEGHNESIVTFWGADAIKSICNYCVIIRRGKKEGLATPRGEIILEPLFDFIEVDSVLRGFFIESTKPAFHIEIKSYSDGLVAAYTDDNKDYHFLNRKGESILVLSEEWQIKTLGGYIGWVEHCFHNGKAELRRAFPGWGYEEEAYEIDMNGVLLRQWRARQEPPPGYGDDSYYPESDVRIEDGNMDESERLYRSAFDDDSSLEWNIE